MNTPGPRPCQARACHAAAIKRVQVGDAVHLRCLYHFKEDYEGRFFVGTVTNIDLSGGGPDATETQRNATPNQKETP